ncbi:MAG TPA: kinase, partial [Dysgonomonas sp.]|nr:kinase [Dysgonomonas sp.]
RTLSANVNYTTSSFSRYNQENLYNPNEGTASTRSSTINLSQRFPNSPFTINANMTANQVVKDSTISLTLPNLTVTMSSIKPFKRNDAVGAEKWYEKIKMSYTGDFRNSITTKDNLLFKSNLIKDWKNGAQHRIPVSATFNLFDYINITPAFNYQETWFTRSVEKRWDPATNNHISMPGDTTYGFYRTYNFDYNVSLQTKLYGMYEPLFKVGKVQAIRHVFTPSITFGGNPDFTDPKYGAYKRYYYIDSKGRKQEERYSPYTGQVFLPPSARQAARVSFSFENNVEMKVGTENDSTKIVSLIDNLGISFDYNAMSPSSNKWSDIRANLRLKLTKSLTVNLNTTWDPYTYSWDPYNEMVQKGRLRILEGKGIGRLKSTSYSFSPTINQDTFKKLFRRGDNNNNSNNNTDEDSLLPDDELEDIAAEEEETQERTSAFSSKQGDTGGDYDSDGYLRNEIKWSLSPTYNMSYGWDISANGFNVEKQEYRTKITHTFSLNGSIQPTRNWNFTFNTSYNFDFKKFEYLNCTLSRNLHCWNISASFIPIGPRTSYYVSIRVNSSMLQDLKYEQRSRPSSYDPQW